MSVLTTLDDIHAVERLRIGDLEEARAIQEMMMPTETLRRGLVTVSHEFHPAAEVGGDFLDYFELSDGNIGIFVGDVCGKGLPAAMYAALTVGTIRGVHKTGQMPREVVSLLNQRLLFRGSLRRHCALQYAVYDPRSRQMHITSAGMPGPLHLTSKGCRDLKLEDIPPGLFPTTTYEMSTLSLEPGDSVLFYTDGITEAFNTENEQFGTERLRVLCAAHRTLSASEMLKHVVSSVVTFAHGREQHDDIAAALFCLGAALPDSAR
jgi:sigma-B regulation protein RsbU (phosphoserine phosphatase)